jgi:hypothetical protein
LAPSSSGRDSHTTTCTSDALPGGSARRRNRLHTGQGKLLVWSRHSAIFQMQRVYDDTEGSPHSPGEGGREGQGDDGEPPSRPFVSRCLCLCVCLQSSADLGRRHLRHDTDASPARESGLPTLLHPTTLPRSLAHVVGLRTSLSAWLASVLSLSKSAAACLTARSSAGVPVCPTAASSARFTTVATAFPTAAIACTATWTATSQISPTVA